MILVMYVFAIAFTDASLLLHCASSRIALRSTFLLLWLAVIIIILAAVVPHQLGMPSFVMSSSSTSLIIFGCSTLASLSHPIIIGPECLTSDFCVG